MEVFGPQSQWASYMGIRPEFLCSYFLGRNCISIILYQTP